MKGAKGEKGEKGEITLADALEQVEANSVKGRTDGLADLTHILRANTRVETLSDPSFHRIYEALFRLTVLEQSAYPKTKTNITRSTAENRLSACASALRLAVERGVKLVKLKTVKSVLDHVAETLVLPGGKFCEPIALDYAKSMKALLSYPAHVEHLPQAERERISLFCLDCVSQASSDFGDDDAAPGAEATSIAGTSNGHSYRSSRSQFKESGGSQGSRSLDRQIVEEMVACLALLTAAPNKRGGSATSTILWGMIDLLKKTTSVARAHADAFDVINNILGMARVEDIGLTRKAVNPLIRLIRFYWPNKSSERLKAEMLKSLLYLRSYIVSALVGDDVTARSEMKGLLEVMRSEYGKRQEKEQLHLEDLRLHVGQQGYHQIGFGIFNLQNGSARSEANWATLYMIASLYNLLSGSEDDRTLSGEDDEDDINPRPRKRQRTTNEFEALIGFLASDTVPSRLGGLQALTFMAQQAKLSSKRIGTLVDKLSSSCNEENSSIASWALLALTGLASQVQASDARLSSRWASVWQLAIRAMNNAVTCRAACQLLLVMLRTDIASPQNIGDLSRMLTQSIEVAGPTTLADSALRLFSHVIKVMQRSNPTSASAAAESMINWLFRHFVPSMSTDKRYASLHSSYEPADIVELVDCCLGHPGHASTTTCFPVLSAVGGVWSMCAEEEKLLDYLLLLPDIAVAIYDMSEPFEVPPESLRSRASCETTLLNLLVAELHRAQELWSALIRERPLGINMDMFSTLCSSVSVASCVASCSSFRDERRQTQLQRQVQGLFDQMVGFASSRNCDQEKVDSMLMVFSSACSKLLTSDAPPRKCEERLCKAIHDVCEARRGIEETKGTHNDDTMDFEYEYDSQDSRQGPASNPLQDLKHEAAAGYTVASMRSSVSMYAAAITKLFQDSSTLRSSSASMVDYILSLPPDTILSSRCVVSRLPEIGIDLLAEDAERLLELCTEDVLPAYLYERSEVATGVVLDIMSSLVSLWTSPARKSLFDLGIDMYAWYTTTALTGGVLSPKVQKRVAVLLLQLCHVNTEYPHDSDVPSARTSLFQLLQIGSITVLFDLAGRISTIFGLFILSKHTDMFDDLQSSLPKDTEWVEGVAMRLLFLAKLASSWPSLLRQSVFYMFETAGLVQGSSKHAARCISELAGGLKFASPQELFHLFAPQLLYTWFQTETHTIDGLPFSAFQYNSLNAMILYNRTEITAQLLMRANDEGMQIVAGALDTTVSELAVHSFIKCAAYCIGRDLEAPPGQDETGREARLRKLVGREACKTLMETRSPAIIAQFYISAQLAEKDRWFEKREDYAPAALALAEIKRISHSDKPLPAPQQPSFKGRALCDQILRLCKRTSQNAIQPWDSSSFSLAARMLINTIHDALGTLHTCLVIRKLRLLICMSGDVPFSGFPIEMLIHTLRPYLSDSQCADDVIGILQYLFTHGQKHLRTIPAFLFGTITLIILRMRQHSAARQESTTQESQHKQTVQKMQSFQAWLVGYLQKCLAAAEPRHAATYATLARALGAVQLPGNAQKGSPESSLMLLLLEQDAVDHAALRASDRNEALVLLSENFIAPSSFTEDCLSLDEECVQIAQKIWTATRIAGMSDSFLSWAAGVIGRAYASAGLRPVSEATSKQRLESPASTKYEGLARSQAAVANRLAAMLHSRERHEASLADYTLRSIEQSFPGAEDAIAFEQMLPDAVVRAVTSGTYGYVPDFAIPQTAKHDGVDTIQRVLESPRAIPLGRWVQKLGLVLCSQTSNAPILSVLGAALQHDAELAMELVPYIVHMLLVRELDQEQGLRAQLSTALATSFGIPDIEVQPKQKYLLTLLLYLRSQKLPNEKTDADRLHWLEVDWLAAAQAADRCGMFTTALMFAESAVQPSPAARRSSSRASLSQISMAQIPQELLLSVFKSVEEPDSFYGVEQPASLDSVLERLDYEADGYKSLMFRSAQTNTDIQSSGKISPHNNRGLIYSLSLLNLDSLTFALLSSGFESAQSSAELMETARRLQQWDVAAPGQATSNDITNCFSAFRELSRVVDTTSAVGNLDTIIIAHMKSAGGLPSYQSTTGFLGALAVLVEAKCIVGSPSPDAFCVSWDQIRLRQRWMKMAPFEDSRLILSCRQTVLNTVLQNRSLVDTLGLKQSRKAELESLLDISRSAREHGQLQEALTATSQLNSSVRQAALHGIKGTAAAMLETASVLWRSDEPDASVRMLRDAVDARKAAIEDLPIDLSGLLAQLAHQLAEARLEKPDDILSKYLKPAISHLQNTRGEDAGKVFYEFASFCDRQLQNPGNIEDFNHIAKLRQAKEEEVKEYEKVKRPDKDTVTATNKARMWLNMDTADYKRLREARDTFLEQSLQNYMLALCASDDHDISILRFFALWLEHVDASNANEIVEKHLPQVPSWKFVVLMNQLMSRLENNGTPFQTSLKSLIRRICSEHPYHCLHHLFAATRPPSKTEDQAAISRTQISQDIRLEIQNKSKAGPLLRGVFKANNLFNELAFASIEDNRPGSQLAVQDMPSAAAIARNVPGLHVPPATISIALRPDGTYADIPTIVRYRSTMRIYTGNSKPKRLDAIASDGRTYIELYKSNDDLRQDAIMEQVFAEVSKMLHKHRTTRQRNLQVRTYCVVPLSTQSGIIQFVPNSTSLTDYLSPAHQKYYPHDVKHHVARDKIKALEKHSTESRVKEYRNICKHMQPVLRHFFFERFKDPDEWFAKRTAYTRTTAAISILGHVLGLGDRHCQNIMLDEKTGEVVHIDLGIAFEAGKVLPVPERVPFRLSRDVVDGMGITKTEGVFRRCCEFTMDALREDKDSIMTLLNVLRYDPLYNWSISPLRAKRMQEQTARSTADGEEGGSSRREPDAGEADRALSVVEKKLSKSLSTAATVNELIQQAVDERNLGTLFVGWSAYW